MWHLPLPGYPLLAFELVSSEIIGGKLGQPLGTKDSGECFIAFSQFRMGSGCTRIRGLAAQFPLIQLAAGEIWAFKVPHHKRERKVRTVVPNGI